MRPTLERGLEDLVLKVPPVLKVSGLGVSLGHGRTESPASHGEPGGLSDVQHCAPED